MKQLICLIVCMGLFFQPIQAQTSSPQCAQYFSKHKSLVQTIQNTFSESLKLQNARGYAVIVSVMLFSAGVSSLISARVAVDYPFMTYFISQLSVLGIVVIGAPIWEPLASYIREKAFTFNRAKLLTDKSYLEELWHSTQQNYSINSQMSRNVVTSALNNIQLNLYQSYKAFQEGDAHYAILQIASMAIRLRTLYSDIHPQDKQIALAFRSILNIQNLKIKNPNLASEILEKISELDSDGFHKNRSYYERLLKAWLD